MATDAPELDSSETLKLLERALAEEKISPAACENVRKWLLEPRYREYEPVVRQHIRQEKWRELDDAFWTVIPFGTGGRRGRMYPIGCNAINDRTIGESAAGLAQYVKQQHDGQGELSCAIAYDTRHNSRRFAELCSRIMVAAGFKVYYLNGYRSTPALSFMVRYKNCSCGIMVTASHNPPSDNAVKVYWAGGVQVLPPHDRAIIDCVMNVQDIDAGVDFDAAVADGLIVDCTEEVDAAFIEAVKAQSFPGPRRLKILFSPLHGVGGSAVCPALEAAGFDDVEVFAPHAEPNGDFPNVPGHVSNPERPVVFEAIIERGKEIAADLILATDPDCDRIGCAAPVTDDPAGDWTTFTGNQIAVLLADYVLQQRKQAGTLTADHYLVKTLVTTEMVRRVGDSYGVRTIGDLLVGFKWIGGAMDDNGPEKFVFGAEESHGYLAGTHARDKDGAVAAMLMAELAACVKDAGQTLAGRLDALYRQHGYHAEKLRNQQMEGSEGMARMKSLMAAFRESPPTALAGIEVAAVRDYLNQKKIIPHGESKPLDGPKGDMVIVDLAEEGNYVAVRPSGTEPKVKFYMFTYVAPDRLTDLDATRQDIAARLERMEADLAAFCETV